MPEEPLAIGIDVGGTNTDAVALDPGGRVVARTKTPTTRDPADGIATALAAVTPAGRVIARVALGTTHATNAIVQRRGLGTVAVLRLGAPGSTAVPPFAGWPRDLVEAVAGPVLVARGGVEVDGRRLPLDPDEIRRFGQALEGAQAISVTGIFSPLDDGQEREAEALLAEVTDLPVTRGHEIGGVGLLERENAAIVNAALGDVMARVIDGLVEASAALGAPAFLAQNDGTLMTPAFAGRLPVLTVGSGPSNSLRGAAALTGRTDCIVVDVGGTTTDVGALRAGFPRASAVGVTVGGARTNFRMPDLVSVAVGGGTVVEGGALTGRSLGADLVRDALVFGGPTATLTDVAVAAGRAVIGTDPVRAGRDDAALADADAKVAEAISRMRTSPEPVDVVVIGGGGVLLPAEIAGASATIRPEHADVANAIGAASAPVAGEADLIADVGGDARSAAIERCLEEACRRAVEAGAAPDALETVWVDEVPLAYLDRPMSRLRAKVAGAPA
jgi:N-methylhydantoinase A/oxoprolinase/acetone carboxylase beta subunit